MGERGRVGVRVEVGDEDGVGERGHLGLEAADDVHAVEGLAAVGVAVDGEEDLGLDLGEAVDDRAGAEVGRAGGPDRADGGGGEEADDGLGAVGQVGGDAVAALDAEGAEAGGEGGDALRRARPR